MKRILLLLLILSLLCFTGCAEEETGTKYTLVGIQLTDGGYMNESVLRQQSGGEDLYIRLYDNGTAKLKIQKGEPVEMHYDDLYIWNPQTPDLKAAYHFEDNGLSILDYPFLYHFEK